MAEKPDWKIEIGPNAQEQMAEHPEAAELVRDMIAQMHQALHDLDQGKFSSMDEALRSIGMVPADEDFPGAPFPETPQ